VILGGVTMLLGGVIVVDNAHDDEPKPLMMLGRKKRWRSLY